MGPVELLIVIAMIAGIAWVVRSILRRGGPDRSTDRGAYSSSAETTASFAAMGAVIAADDAHDHGSSGGDGVGGWGGDAGGGGDGGGGV